MFEKRGGFPYRFLMASLYSLSFPLQNPRSLLLPNPKPSIRFCSPRLRTFWRCAWSNGEKDSGEKDSGEKGIGEKDSGEKGIGEKDSGEKGIGEKDIGEKDCGEMDNKGKDSHEMDSKGKGSGERDNTSPASLPAEKRSLAVATGELFLGLASVLFRNRKRAIVLPEEEDARYSGNGKISESLLVRPVIWEQRTKDLEVERERMKVTSPGFSFSAAGLLFPYHLGVARILLEKGYIKETTPLAGSSAGAIVCAVIASGNCMQDALQVTKVLAEDCRLKGTVFRLGAVLRKVLNDFLPEDVHIRSNGRVRVAITQLSWRPRGLLVDQFDSKEDLINALVTSSFIPGYLAPTPATIYRNRLCIDGGLTMFLPPTSASKTVRICAFPTKQFGLTDIGISPDCNPENRASPRQLFNWALEPAEDDVLDRLFELGCLDAQVWAEQNPVDGNENTCEAASDHEIPPPLA